jgi:hypothetical protein
MVIEEQYRRAEGASPTVEELDDMLTVATRMTWLVMLGGFISGLLVGGGAVALLMA